MLVALLHLLLQFCLLVKEFLLHLQQFFLFNHFGFLTGRHNHLVVFSLQDITENQVSANTTHNKGSYGNDN